MHKMHAHTTKLPIFSFAIKVDSKKTTTTLFIHSSIRVDIHTHIQVLSKSSNIFRKLTRWGVQKSLVTIIRVHPLIEVLGAIHNPRYIKRVNCRGKK